MPTDEFYFGVTFQGNKRIFTPKSRNGKLHLPGQWAGSFSKDRPLGWDPVAAGNRAGDGMARFTCAGKLPATLCNSIYNKALSANRLRGLCFVRVNYRLYSSVYFLVR